MVLRVVTAGPADAPPVVLLHGQPGSPRGFDDLVAALPDHRTYAVERPGWGTSTAAAGGFRLNARMVADWLAAHDDRPAVVVGHSWGAGVALEMALTHPRHVAALVLIGPIGARSAVTRGDRVLALPLLGPVLARIGLRTVAASLPSDRLRRALAWEFEAVAVERRAPAAAFWASRQTARAFVIEQRAFVQTAGELADRLGEVRVPAVVMVGERDRIVAPVHARALAGELPHGRLVEMPGGHLLHLDDPGAVADVVRGLTA